MIRLLLVLAAVVAAAPGTPVSVIHDPRITESSGLAASTAHPGLAYTVNDSGSAPVVYTLQIATGKVVGTTRLTGVQFTDTEALALDGRGTLWVADIGDNESVRSHVALYAFAEQGRGEHSLRPAVYRLTYPDGPHDAETLLLDRRSGHKQIVTKSLSGARVYDVPDRLSPARTGRLTPGRRLPGFYTDGDVSTDGRLALLLTYTDVTAFRLPQWTPLATIPISGLPQAETLTLEPGGRTFLAGSEGADSPLLRFATPPLAEPSTPASTQPPVQSPSPRSHSGSSGRGVRLPVVVGGVVTALLVAALALAARRRR